MDIENENVTVGEIDGENGSDIENKSRQLVKIVTEICTEQGITLKKHSYDHILELEKGKKRLFIIGYRFPNNNAAAQMICDDKAALSTILESHGLPVVEHRFFMDPAYRYIDSGNWSELRQLLDAHKRLVIKRNKGSGGKGCYVVDSYKRLESVTNALFRTNRDIAVSPYYEIENEYRVIVLNSKVMIAYCKERMSVVGDGVKVIAALIYEKFGGDSIGMDLPVGMESHRIPAAGEKIALAWKHNLSKGARAEIVRDTKLLGQLSALALTAAAKIGISFASVDIVQIDGKFRVLEINSGVMMEHFASQDEDCYAKAKAIYKEAIEAVF